MPIEESIKNERLDLRVLNFFQLLRIAVLFFSGRAVAFGVDVGREEDVLAIR